MEKKCATKFVLWMSNRNFVNIEEAEIYVYGFELLISSFISILETLLIGASINKIMFSIGYLAGFIPIRIFAGGYHAKTHNRCYLMFLIIFLICNFIPYSKNNSLAKYIVIYISLFFLIRFCAPLQAENKKLDEHDEKNYRRYALIILIISAIFGFPFIGKESCIWEGMLSGKIAVILFMLIQIAHNMLAGMIK